MDEPPFGEDGEEAARQISRNRFNVFGTVSELVLSNVRLHFSEALERDDDCTNLNSRLDAAVTLRSFTNVMLLE